MSNLSNGWRHLKTINYHKALVMKHCFKVGLYWQGLTHDLSKYSPTEFRVGVEYFQGTRSPNAAEREATGVSTAWLHHKGRNKHHFEYWVDIRGNMDGTLEGKLMPTRYIVEMFCDRVAASKVYKGAAYQDGDSLDYYYLEEKAGNVLMHPASRALLKSLLEMLAEEGEDAAFRHIKRNIVQPRYVYHEKARW